MIMPYLQFSILYYRSLISIVNEMNNEKYHTTVQLKKIVKMGKISGLMQALQ